MKGKNQMRKQLTAEQQAKALERKAKFKALWKQVANITEIERIQLSQKFGFRTVEGRELSLCNQMLIAMQLPTASVLGGFRQWIKNGRCVRKGEHGAMIWCPTGKKQDSPEVPAVDVETAEVHFIIGTVFDIGQTEELKNKDQAEACGNPEIVTVNSDFVPSGRINTLELATS
jgi:N-terminal domain of anti-restriction factor ArdC